MLCDDCQKKAACVHITTVIGDKKTEKHLCEICAQKLGELGISQKLHNLFGPKMADNLHEFINEILNCDDKEEAAKKVFMQCPECGLSYQDFSRNGKLGCGGCYSSFAKDLKPLIKKIHNSFEHKGKIAKRSLALMSVEEKIKNLRLKLNEYIVREEYEQAAVLRDKIRSLESDLTSGKEAETNSGRRESNG